MKERPTYETAADRDRETAVVSFLEAAWDCRAAKLPVQYRLDYLLRRPDGRACMIEIKCRRVRRLAVPFLILSAAKVVHARTLARELDVAVLFVFAFEDGEIAFIDAREAPREVHLGGRSDRGDWQDIEPVVRIPTPALRVVRPAEMTTPP